jgi:hypothetical protein
MKFLDSGNTATNGYFYLSSDRKHLGTKFSQYILLFLEKPELFHVLKPLTFFQLTFASKGLNPTQYGVNFNKQFFDNGASYLVNQNFVQAFVYFWAKLLHKDLEDGEALLDEENPNPNIKTAKCTVHTY